MSDIPAQGAAESGAEANPGGMRLRWGAPRCGYYSNLAMLWIGARFLWLGYALVWLVALYFLLFVGDARRASMRYLDRLRPGRSAGRRWWETYRHLVEFGILLLDRALMLAGPRHGFAISCDGLEHFAAASAAPSGMLLLTAHFGNAEIAAPYISRMGITRPTHIVMYLDPNDATEKFHLRYRRLLEGINIISTTDPLAAGARIIKALREGDLVALRADRTLHSRGIAVDFLGGKIALPAGPFMAAALSGAPLVHVYTCRLGYRRYLCRLRPVRPCGDDLPPPLGSRDERLAASAQDYATGLEEIVRQYPYQWSNFYDYWTVQRANA